MYHYYVPRSLGGHICPGTFVAVPFGNGNRKKLALTAQVCTKEELPPPLEPDRLKPVGGICHERLSLSGEQLSLCFYLKETTLCTMGEAVRTVVPAPALASLVEYYRAVPEGQSQRGRSPGVGSLSAGDLMVLEHIRTREYTSAQALRSRFGAQANRALERLCERGLIEKELSVRQPDAPTPGGKRTASPPSTVFLTLARPVAEVEAILRGDVRDIRLTSPIQRKVLEALIAAGGRLDAAQVRVQTGAGTPSCKSLLLKGLITSEEAVSAPPEEIQAEPLPSPTPFVLNQEQTAAVAVLSALCDSGQPKAALLHGVTGSGKTCVILSMIDRVLAAGRGAIVLLPEIGLTPQMLSLFRARYGDRVAVIHSNLSQGERLESYRRIRSGEAPVVVGTRSAVFAPVPHLGMIVMDEEQEHTYKSDMNPKYHARDIARFRCATDSALLLLASATPSLESYQKAMEGKYTLISMRNRYGAAHLPTVHMSDMRQEPQSGNTTPLGQELVAQLRRVVSQGEQAVLFINRRGYSTQVVCRSCGRAVTCPHCSVAMNYHTRRGSYTEGDLVCHWCGARRPYPAVCPDCGSPHLMRMGYGTQRVEQELASLVPGARVMRMDADTTGTKTAYRELLGGFRRHEADILLGTQMVTKGHDFPDVTLVGVLLADMSLYLDDYRAGERTFSLLTQVIGRAGRADKPGLAVIQTMNPDSDILRLACAQDYQTFFAQEIKLRRLLTFPPFCDIALLTLTSPDEKELQKACLRLSQEVSTGVRSQFPDVPLQIFGPFEAPVYRVDNVYRMRMVVKCRLTKRSRQFFSALLSDFSTGSGGGRGRPLLSVDFNPSTL
jgi:primosomal protein N' (replication factor Y)